MIRVTRSLLILSLVVGLVGCPSRPIRPECRAEYAYTIPSCGVKRPATRREMLDAGYIEFCDGRRPCYWVSRQEMERALRQPRR